MKTLLLIDANSIIHRTFHALPPFTAADGKPTGALYGLASIFLKLWREEKPDYAAVLFDRPEPTFREKKYKEYKAQRPPSPNDLISQIIEAHNLFRVFGLKTFESPGFEADDLIATAAEKFVGEPDLKIIILTGDRDTLQLVRGEKVVVRTFNKGVSDTTVYNEKAVFEKYGLEPGQLVDYKALVGDPSDNIKGVLGVGPKTATELLRRYGTLDKIYGEVAKDKKLEKLAQYRKEAELSKELVILRRDAPTNFGGLEGLRISFNEDEAEEYFEKLGFKALIKRMKGGEADFREKNQLSQPTRKRESGKLL